METKLSPIFMLRAQCLQKLNPYFYNKNDKLINASSLAAQDYVFSGTHMEYSKNMGLAFHHLPGYMAVHKKYNLPYNPDSCIIPAGGIHPGLVMDLAWSFQQDALHSIIDGHGNIIAPEKLTQSEVLHVYHNSGALGVPIDALKTITRYQFNQMVKSVQNTR